jgi:nicotinamidase-related amidase
MGLKKYTIDLENKPMLMLVDFQDKLAPQIAQFDQITERSVILKKAFDLFGLETVATEQYPNGLGRSDKRLLDVLKEEDLVVDKTSFDSYTKEVKDFVKENEIKEVIVTGAEGHVCVYHTVRSLLKKKLKVFVVEDAVSSYSLELKENAIKNMRDMGAVIVSSEMVLFDLIKDSKHENFKEISNLVKEIRKIK